MGRRAAESELCPGFLYRRILHLKQFHRGVDVYLIFREDERGALEGGDGQLFDRAHFPGLSG